VTLAEAARESGVPATYLTALVVVAGVPATGVRRGGPGRPPVVYDAAALAQACRVEAARTPKGFTDADWLASALLARRLVRADAVAGAIWWAAGGRAESVLPSGYGVVRVGRGMCMAHRLVWISVRGCIPPAVEVVHRNRRRWDNAVANLQLRGAAAGPGQDVEDGDGGQRRLVAS